MVTKYNKVTREWKDCVNMKKYITSRYKNRRMKDVDPWISQWISITAYYIAEQ